MIDPEWRPAQGAQVVGRVVAVLKFLGSALDEGAGTTEVATSCRLSRPTTHRLLSTLAREGLVERRPDSAKWRLGPEIYFLGALARGRYDMSADARPFLRDLADRTGESAFLSTRRGRETLCLLREEGSFPLRSFVLHEGSRFPLGVGSVGIALLSCQTPDWVDEYLAEHDLTGDWGPQHTAPAVRDRVDAARELGYSVNPGLILEGSFGMGVLVRAGTAPAEWALSITGVESRFRTERQPELGQAMLEIAGQLAASAGHAPAELFLRGNRA